MDKKAILKVGSISLIVLAVIVAIVVVLFSGRLALASDKTTYFLGDKIRIDLGDNIGEYSLKIKTPSQEYVQKLNNSKFIFEPKEVGDYSILIHSKDLSNEIIFIVVNPTSEISQDKPSTVEPSSKEEINLEDSKDLHEVPDGVIGQVEVGKEVTWTKSIKESGRLNVRIPQMADNVSVDGESLVDYEVKESIIDKVSNLFSDNPEKSVLIESSGGDLKLEYTTPAPEKTEREISDSQKEVVVSSTVHYQNVLVNSKITQKLLIRDLDKLRVYWKENDTYLEFSYLDDNNDGYVDSINWIAPHLSTQTFEIILISKAQHLDSNRNFIEDIYDKVSNKDDYWASIGSGEFIRVNFEKKLTNKNDITLYARSSNGGKVEVYGADGDTKLATFDNIGEEKAYQIILDNLDVPTDTFDLKVVDGSVDFDYIVDPIVNSTATYDVNTSKDTVWGQPTSSSLWSAGTNASTTQYNNMSTDNSSYAKVDAASTNDEPFWRFNFTIGPAAVDINSINVTFKGFANASETATAYIWNYTSSAWITIANLPTTNGNITATYTAGINHLLGSGNRLTIAVEGSNFDPGDFIFVDYVSVRVNYNYTLNDAPNTPATKINSTVGLNSTTEDLNCFATISDINGNSTNVTVNWFKNGGLNSTYFYNNSYANATAFNATLLHGNTTVGENWSCSLRLYDGQNYSIAGNSSNLTIVNLLPFNVTVIKINSTSAANTTNDNVICNTNISDLDGDLMNVTIRWLKNGIINSTYFYNNSYSNNTLFNGVLSSGNLSVGENWSCSLRLYDGQNYSTFLNSTNVTITSPPAVVNITINTPVNGSSIRDITPLLNFTLTGNASWSGYSVDGGSNVTMCTSCNGSKTVYIWLNESVHNIFVFANNSAGVWSSNQTNFTINMHYSYNDSYDDNSSIFQMNNVNWSIGNVTYYGKKTLFNNETVDAQGHGFSASAITEDAGTLASLQTDVADPGVAADYLSYEMINPGASNNITQNFSYNVSSLGITGSQIRNLSFMGQLFLTGGYNSPGPEAGDPLECDPVGNATIQINNGTGWETLWPVVIGQQSLFNNGDAGPAASWDSEASPFVRFKSSGFDNNYINSSGYINLRFSWLDLDCRTGITASPDAAFIWDYAFITIQTDSGANFTSYAVNTSSQVVSIENVTWNESGTSSPNSNLSVEVSADNGVNWYSAVKNQGITSIAFGSNLLYRVLFAALNSTYNPTIFDVNVTWGDVVAQAPNIFINSPTNGSTITDVSPTLNVTIDDTATTLKYSINGASNVTICSSCSGIQTTYLYLAEGTYTVVLFTANDIGSVNSNSTTFTIETNLSHFETYNDNSSLLGGIISGVNWSNGNVSYFANTTQQMFLENFSDISDWTFTAGTWSVSSGELLVSSNTANSLAIYKNFNLTPDVDYNLSAVVFETDNDNSGLLFRYINSTFYYRCNFIVQGGAAGSLQRVANGVATNLATVASAYTQSIYNNYSVSIVNDTISCYVNGVRVLSASDNSWENGQVGIYTSSQQNNRYDNYTVFAYYPYLAANFTAYNVNVTESITSISNVTWNESGTDSNNKNITLQVSPNGGATWYSATKNQGISGIDVGSSLVYRVFFKTNTSANLTLNDVTINWSSATIPVVGIKINYPVNGTTVKDVTPVLNVTLNATAKRLWYSMDNGITNTTICTDCTDIQTAILYLNESDFIVRVWANNSAGVLSLNSSIFTIYMNKNYNDTFGDNSSLSPTIVRSPSVLWNVGNISFTSSVSNLFNDNFSSSLSNKWQAVGGWTQSSTRSVSATQSAFAQNTGQGNLDSDYIDTRNMDLINVSFYYNEHLLEDADIAIYFYNGSAYNLIDQVGADQAVEDVWYFKNYTTNSSQYKISNFGVRFVATLTAGETVWVDDVNVSGYVYNGNFTSYYINVTQPVRSLTNISWNEANTNTSNNISVYVSVNGGTTWYNVTNNQALNGITAGSSLVYRVFFNTSSFNTTYLLDMNISWSAPPVVTIRYPIDGAIYNTTITQLNFTAVPEPGINLSMCWWSNNSGVTNRTVTCGQNVTTASVSGLNNWTVWSNDTSGSLGVDRITFTVDLNAPTIVFINQTKILNQNVTSSNPLEQGQTITFRANVTDFALDKVWIIIWETVKGGVEKVRTFFTYLAGAGIWIADVATDINWNLTSYNYTIYANDTAGSLSQYDNNFNVTRLNSSLTLSPNPSSGSGNVTVSGFLMYLNGTTIPNAPINLWLNGSLLLYANITSAGGNNNFQNKTDTSDSDFTNGTFYHTNSSGGNLTLLSGNNVGNFTKILDAGARVEWDSLSWNVTGKSCTVNWVWQDGTNGFDGTSDTYLDGSTPGNNYGTLPALFTDTSPLQRVAVSFDIFGSGAYKVPYNSTIIDANITVSINDSGDALSVYEILENWTEAEATYNNRISSTAWGSAGIGGSPSRSTTLESSFTPSTTGNFTFNVTNAMKRWVNQTTNNYGVVLSPGGTNTVEYRSSENSIASERPKLTARFSSTDCTNVIAYVRFSNDNVTWSSWQQVSNNNRVNDTDIASRYMQYRLDLFSFNSTNSPDVLQVVANYTAIVTNSTGGYAYNFTSPSTFGTYPFIMNTSLRTMFTNASGSLQVQVGVTPWINLVSPATGTWFNYTNFNVTYNSTDLNGDLVNASLIINGRYNQSNSTVLNNGFNNFSINFGSGQYNWSVNVSDATNKFNSTINWTFYIDLENPVVRLIYPANASSFALNSVNLSFNATDNMDTNLTCSINLDGATIYSGLGISNATGVNYSSGTLASGLHYWNVTCFDESLRSNYTETRMVNITDTPPTVTLDAPVNAYVDSDGNITFGFNVTDNSGITNCSLIINGTYRTANQTSIAFDDVLPGFTNYINATNLVEGFYNWTVECFDLSLSRYSPTPRNFTVDLTNPKIGLNLPNNATTINSGTVNFNFTANDTIDTSLLCNLTVNGVIVSNLSASNATLTNQQLTGLSDGLKYWNVTCMDDALRTNTSITQVVTVAEPPRVLLNTTNLTSFSTSSITLSFTPTDNTGFGNCSVYLNGAYNDTNQSDILAAQQNDIVIDGMTDGRYDWYVNCSDSFGNSNISEIRVFFVDAAPPLINLIYPNGQEILATNITFNFTGIDALDSILDCNLSVDGALVDGPFSAFNNTITSRSVSGISDGYHTWYVNCSDNSNNVNGSLVYNFTKSTAPNITLVSPSSGYWFNTSTFNLTYYLLDDVGFQKSYLIINGTMNKSNSSALANSGDNNFTVNNIADGIYNWTVIGTDAGGLNGTDTERIFYVDTNIPQLVLNSPTSQQLISSNNVTINFTVTDLMDSVLNCSLDIDFSSEFTGTVSNNTPYINYQLLSDGFHYVNVTCFDNALNYNYSSVINFTIEAPPVVNLTAPVDNYKSANFTFNFSYIPSDLIGITSCDMIIDSVVNQTNGGPTPNVVNNFSVSGIAEGVHNWTVNCSDSDNNWNWSTERIFTRDITGPNITLNSPVNASYVNANSNVLFNWTPVDALDSSLTCNIYVDNVVKGSNLAATSGFASTRTVSGLSLGTHNWNVTCWDTVVNNGTSSIYTFTYAYPDFFINESEIYFNTTSPTENSSVNVTATVRNIGLVNSSSVGVRFYSGDPDAGGTQISSTQSITLPANSFVNVSVLWTVPIGTTRLYVVVDHPTLTNGSINETNETNNKATINMSVDSWNFFYGNLDTGSEFVLEDSAYYKINIWDQSNSTNANIYVTDYDSNVDWTNLQAIGKNSSGANASNNDFEEIDTALNSTGFRDSVNRTYTTANHTNATLNFTIFKYVVPSVPIATSINSSNFKTGILWDKSDTIGDSEYDSSDKEDLVFVTRVSQDTSGSYGLADYELRVPALLRNYKVTDNISAAFYMELI